MPTPSSNSQNATTWLLRPLDQAYDRKSWHGPNLKGSIRGVQAPWREAAALLEAQHRALRAAVATLDPAQLHDTPPASKTTWLDLIQGIAFHDVYHADQIQGLKRLHSFLEEDG